MADLTTPQRELLAQLAKSTQHFNLAGKYDKALMTKCRELARMGLCREHETGPGGRSIAFVITDKGKAELNLN